MKAAYQKRSIRNLGNIQSERAPDVVIKLYGITARAGQDTPYVELIDAGKDIAIDKLLLSKTPPIPETDLTIAVACIHEAADGQNYLTIAKLAFENVYLLTVLKIADTTTRTAIPLDNPTPLCMWELAVLEFEMQMWAEKVLKNRTPNAVEEYLLIALNTNI